MEELKALYKKYTYFFIFTLVFVSLISFVMMVVKWPITGLFALLLVIVGLLCHLLTKIVMIFTEPKK